MLLLNIEDIRYLCNDENIAITKHAKNRLFERGIKVGDIQNAIMTGEIIEQYEDDKPFPSCLILGLNENNNYIHIVVSKNHGYLYIITAYIPDENEWESDLKSRKEQSL